MSRSEGFSQIPNWLIKDSDAGVYELAVYAALASHSGKGGIWPSQETIAKLARCSERQVRDALTKLRDLGVVTWEKKRSSRGIINVYLLHSEGHPVTSVPDDPPAHSAGPSGTQCRTPPAHSAGEEEPIEEEPFKGETPPKAVDNSEPFCSKHMPYGPFGKPCRGCADAKRAYEHAKRKPTPIPPRGPVDPESCSHKFVGGWCVWCPTPQVVLV